MGADNFWNQENWFTPVIINEWTPTMYQHQLPSFLLLVIIPWRVHDLDKV